jgi:hypothetical protein
MRATIRPELLGYEKPLTLRTVRLIASGPE